MEKKSSSMFIPAITYAGIIVGVIIVHTIIIDILELNFSSYNRIAGFIIPLIGIGYAIYGFRKEYNQNIITYQRALGFGVFVSLLVALLVSVFSAIYTFYINPELLEIGKQMAEERMIERGLSPETIERGMEQQQRFQTPVFIILWGTIFTTLIGTVFSLIAAAILKKEPEEPLAGVEE
jgi:hypothetical protein